MEAGAEFRRPTTGLRAAGAHESDGDAHTSELNDAVSRAMEQLPDKQRLALILFSVEGMPQKEVADILECSVELVKWNVFQARKKLKELLREFL
jgi:RNA polymerase sigma-70 factor (ECF subfamily)